MSLKLYTYFRPKYVIFPTLYQNWTAVLKSAACVLETLSLFQTKICDFIYPTCISDLNVCPQECSMFPGNLISISDQNVIFPTLFQNWTAVLKSAACVLETLFLFQTKLCDFPYPTCISDLNFCPQECSMFPGNLISISDQNMWFSLPYTRTELRSSRVQHVLETLFLFQIKICDFPYPISELNCCPWECSMCPGNLIPISDQNMWFSPPYIRTQLLSSRVQHVLWKPYSYFRPKYVIFPTLHQNWTAVLKSVACVLGTLFLFQTKICDFPYPISELNCCPRESSMCPGNFIPITDQNMWYLLPYIRPKILSSRVQHVSWKPYSYFRPTYVIFPTLY